MRKYQQEFFKSALTNSAKSKVRGYTFGDATDKNRTKAFIDKLLVHEIEVYKSGNRFVVPTKQSQYRMVQTMFETYSKYRDSVYYDASAWSVANFYNMKYKPVTSLNLGDKIKSIDNLITVSPVQRSNYAYIIDWDDYNAPAALNYLQKNGLVISSAFKPFTANLGGNSKSFSYGSLVVPVSLQKKNPQELYELLQKAQKVYEVPIYGLNSGYSTKGIDLGSGYVRPIKKVKAAMLIGNGIRSYEAGEVWHLLDTRMDMPISKIPIRNFNGTNWVNLGAGTSGQFLKTQGAAANPIWDTAAGSGDVSASAVLADNALIRGDCGAKGVQDSGILIDDSDNMTGVGSINDNGSGGNNNCIGSGAGAALTTGSYNTLIGNGAGDLITTGGQNIAFGVFSLDANISSSSNTAIGYASLTSATGIANTACGHQSLSGITTSSSNVGIGVDAGRFIAGGAVANATSGTSTYLGALTDASADGNANETVIGYNAIGNGSNSITLGNSSVTDVFVGADNIQTLVAAGTDNNQTGTTYTLVLADEENKTVWMSNASANVLTIPTNASVAFAVGTKINVIMEAAGVTTITGDTGVTVNGTSAGSAVVNNQYQGATLTKRATDTWIISGDIT